MLEIIYRDGRLHIVADGGNAGILIGDFAPIVGREIAEGLTVFDCGEGSRIRLSRLGRVIACGCAYVVVTPGEIDQLAEVLSGAWPLVVGETTTLAALAERHALPTDRLDLMTLQAEASACACKEMDDDD